MAEPGSLISRVALSAVLCCATAGGASAADRQPASCTQEIPGTLVKFDLVKIPSGTIRMPDPAEPGSTRAVKVDSLWFGKTEVTWDEFDVFVYRLDEPSPQPDGKDGVSRPSKPYGTADRGFGHKGYPVINVTYLSAEQYCKWLSDKTRHKYRLPTEAEWEYACRAGASQAEFDSLTRERLAEMAWFWQEKTQPVGKKLGNAWGLHDMLGNVAEWCTDLAGKPVLCGGAYDDTAKKVSPSARKYPDESWQVNDPQEPKSKWWLSDGTFAGFRVVRVETGCGNPE